MPDEYEIQAAMVNTDCDRETAIKALEWSCGRIGWAIKRAAHMQLHLEDFQKEENNGD